MSCRLVFFALLLLQVTPDLDRTAAFGRWWAQETEQFAAEQLKRLTKLFQPTYKKDDVQKIFEENGQDTQKTIDSILGSTKSATTKWLRKKGFRDATIAATEREGFARVL